MMEYTFEWWRKPRARRRERCYGSPFCSIVTGSSSRTRMALSMLDWVVERSRTGCVGGDHEGDGADEARLAFVMPGKGAGRIWLMQPCGDFMSSSKRDAFRKRRDRTTAIAVLVAVIVGVGISGAFGFQRRDSMKKYKEFFRFMKTGELLP
jgi:hypothetical protein